MGDDLGDDGGSPRWTTAGDEVGDDKRVMTWGTRMAGLTADDGGVDGGRWKRGQ